MFLAKWCPFSVLNRAAHACLLLVHCRLEFLLTPDMVCTGLSMLDFKLQVKHSMEALLTRYGKQATALPVQAAPERGATLDRQHQSMSKRRAQQQGQRHSREEVPLGLKATRVAHAAAVSSRVFSPSMRSPYSGQGEPNALPSQHELDDTLGFVQRQGSFHSEHAIQHLMTDQPYSEPSSRHLAKHASLPSQRSLHRRDSANSHQRQSSMPRQSFQTDASDHQSQHSYVSAPRAYSSSRHSQQDGGSHSQRPPLGNSQMIAHSALFQSIPVSPSNGHIPTDHCEHTSHGPHGLSATAGAPHDSYQPSEHCPWQPQYHGQPPSSATAVDRHDRHQADKHRQQDYQPGLSYQSPTALAAPAAAVEVPLTAFLSADSFASDMLSSDNNQTAQWDNSVLQHIQEGSEVAAPQQGVSAHGSLADAALQSADSFASDPLSTDMTNTAHWGKRMLSELHQVAEEEMHQEVQIHQEAQPAVHAALGNLEAEGMHPPTDQAGAGPHDWLWLPDELSSIRDSELSSIDGVRPDIDTWLTQQQASRIASTTQHGTAQRAQHGSSNFKPGDRLQPAVSPTSPLNTADTLDSTYFEDHQADNAMPKAHSSLPWAQNSTSATSYSPQLRPPAHTEELDSGQVPAPEPDTFLPQSSTYTSPFAHWSCAPILGANIQPDQPTVARFDHPQQQERQPDVDAQASTLQGSTYYSNEACAKQRELDSRLAALDLLEFPSGDGDIFEGFGSPLQTRHTSSGQAQPESLGCQLYNTEAPLPVDAPGATLSAPEEALLASMKEMLHGELFLRFVSMPCPLLLFLFFVSMPLLMCCSCALAAYLVLIYGSCALSAYLVLICCSCAWTVS